MDEIIGVLVRDQQIRHLVAHQRAELIGHVGADIVLAGEHAVEAAARLMASRGAAARPERKISQPLMLVNYPVSHTVRCILIAYSRHDLIREGRAMDANIQHTYYLSRAKDSRELAQQAVHPGIAAIHSELAARYDDLVAKWAVGTSDRVGQAV